MQAPRDAILVCPCDIPITLPNDHYLRIATSELRESVDTGAMRHAFLWGENSANVDAKNRFVMFSLKFRK
jgi:hypothetical protein